MTPLLDLNAMSDALKSLPPPRYACGDAVVTRDGKPGVIRFACPNCEVTPPRSWVYGIARSGYWDEFEYHPEIEIDRAPDRCTRCNCGDSGDSWWDLGTEILCQICWETACEDSWSERMAQYQREIDSYLEGHAVSAVLTAILVSLLWGCSLLLGWPLFIPIGANVLWVGWYAIEVRRLRRLDAIRRGGEVRCR